MSGWQKKIGAITLFVEDPDRSKAFYREVFELERALASGDMAASSRFAPAAASGIARAGPVLTVAL